MQAIIAKLNENLQLLYRKAVDADSVIEQLQSQGKGRHQAVFQTEAGFRTKSNKFVPYVAELTDEVALLQQLLAEQKESEFKLQLAGLVKKIEAAFITLDNFNRAVEQ